MGGASVAAMQVRIGQVVRSKSGRDCGRYFVVVDKEGNSIVYLVDGDMRRVEAPKKKNVKHIQLTSHFISTTQQSVKELSNRHIRSVLSEFDRNEDEAD